ncbi:MAG TPA: hypothetical protein ENI31_06160 [Candidatus Omnitrophica bacterium]|nr:hypothetical protein [Candidatus Omnitrophota bacterium]
MRRKSLKAEVAGICSQFNLWEEDSFYFLKNIFKNFLSEKKENFTVDIKPKLTERETGLKLEKFNWDLLDKIRIEKFNTKFHIFSPEPLDYNLGFIDIRKNQCQFNSQPKILHRYLLLPFLRLCFQLFLFKSGGFFLHASAASQQKTGYLFVGPTGSGKSTVINRLSKDFKVLADELVALRKYNGYYCIYSTPWTEKRKKISRLEKIFLLRKAQYLQFKKIKPIQAAFEIYSNILYCVSDYSLTNKLLNTLINLSHKIPCYTMYFALESPLSQRIKELSEN